LERRGQLQNATHGTADLNVIIISKISYRRLYIPVGERERERGRGRLIHSMSLCGTPQSLSGMDINIDLITTVNTKTKDENSRRHGEAALVVI